MKKNSSLFGDIPPRIWAIVIIIMVLAIVLFFVGQFRFSTEKGEFGNLIAGTIGVGASISAMIMIIFSFGEQRKLTKQKEVQTLIKSFKLCFNKFLLSLDEDSKVDIITSKEKPIQKATKTKKEVEVVQRKTCQGHLKDKWYGQNEENPDTESIQNRLNLITKKVRDNTDAKIEQLKLSCNDADLENISKGLLRLYTIKSQIEELKPEAILSINDDLDSISPLLKNFAGFYYGWSTSNNVKLEKILLQNDLTKFFYEQYKPKLPVFIPKIKMVVCREDQAIDKNNLPEVGSEIRFLFSEERLASQKIVLIFNNAFSAKVLGLKISIEPDSKQNLTIPLKINLSPDSKNEIIKAISFRELFGKNYKNFFGFLKGLPLNKDGMVNLNQELSLKYLSHDWFYENKMEFRLYDDNTAGIIFKQFDEEQ